MRVLVSAASRHGATAEIAQRIGATLGRSLREAHVDATVEVRPAEEVTSLDGYDAVVLGSAVYMGRWLEPARRLVETYPPGPTGQRVWLFSSGPLGDPPRPEEQASDVVPAIAATGARDHRTFTGKLDRHRLGLGEKTVVVAMRVPDGDFRDWAAVDGWAGEIAAALRAPEAS